jgi:hypothetical protein
VTEVPEDEPANDAGFGLFPDTVMVKSEGFLLPPDTLVVTINVANDPGGGVGKVGVSGGGLFSLPPGGFVGKVDISEGGEISLPPGGVGQRGVTGGGIFLFAA